MQLRQPLSLTLFLAALSFILASHAAHSEMPKVLKTGQVFKECPNCPEMVVIPPATFMMGSPASDPERKDLEEPQHQVTIAKPFALGRYPVTRVEYQVFATEKGIARTGCKVWDGKEWVKEPDPKLDWRNPGFAQSDKDAVTCVSWEDAKQYVAWLNARIKSARPDGPYRLPTEIEWERAARADTTTRYWWGDEVGTNRANCDGCGSPWDDKRTSPVDAFPPNPFGLYDVAGNVWQWLEDCWNVNYVGAPTDGSAWLSGDCKLRSGRSGAWTRPPRSVRVANRDGQSGHAVNIGFRVARTLD